MQLFSSNFKLGILGGGQLGKMLMYDAKRYDLHTKVMDSNQEAPCAKLADEFIIGDITNYDDVVSFGNKGDTGELPTQVFAHVSGTSKTETGVMLEVEDYGTIDPSQVVRFKN